LNHIIVVSAKDGNAQLKTKAAFTSDNALLKLAFLAIQNMEKIWNKTAFQWKSILSELLITFGDRIQIQKIEI
jgi:transposase-like protein